MLREIFVPLSVKGEEDGQTYEAPTVLMNVPRAVVLGQPVLEKVLYSSEFHSQAPSPRTDFLELDTCPYTCI